MSSWPADVHLATPAPPTAGNSDFARRLYFVLSAIALIYALLAGLRTVSDFDLGWQMATGRWIVLHHKIPSVDVLSYTAAGEPWVYPAGAGILFYLAYLLGGYSLVSWIGALACLGTIALLLRRGNLVTAAVAILAVPVVALRTTPRADMFTVVLFAAFLSLLWEHRRLGHAPLWLLPVLMFLWVNLHLGYLAGLGLMLAYAGAELLEIVFSKATRQPAIARLRRAQLPLLCTVLATLANPWGWGIYRALLRQEHANALQQAWIAEWGTVPLNWTALGNAIRFRQTEGTVYLLLAIAIAGVVFALNRTQLGEAILLLAASYVAVRYARMGAVFACVVVVVATPVIWPAIAEWATRVRPRTFRWIAAVVAALLVTLASLRTYDLVTNRHYLSGGEEASFGTGLSWWFPQSAADFIEREKLPGEIFNSYNEGGFLAWRLGPQRLDYIDGRDTLFGLERIRREARLLRSSPDSREWEEEAARYNIHTIVLSLARYDGIQLIKLQELCDSKQWQPVYMDEVSAIFVNRTEQTEELRSRYPVNCATVVLPARPRDNKTADAFNSWSNAASVLAALGRNSEALSAIDKALDISPDSAFPHWLRGSLLSALGRIDEAEEEYLAAVSLEPGEVTWAALADYYHKHGKEAQAVDAMKRAVALSPRPFSALSTLGYLYLKIHRPDDALSAFNQAESRAPANMKAADGGTFDFMVAQGRSAAWDELGDMARAIRYQEAATQIESSAPEPWRRLAKLYQRAGRASDATRAEENAAAAAGNRER
ncbi:MAG TPA: hypothetical protein VKB58_05775 [Terriglobales bacterium]|jgi:tetratricopeptide (TPR) repeat protein|nr:hypothetical protein [Terriglobales bacterium]